MRLRHNTGWDVKIFCFVALLVGLTFAPNPVFDDHGYVWVARVGAFVFLILQQVILIDSAYCVNECVALCPPPPPFFFHNCFDRVFVFGGGGACQLIVQCLFVVLTCCCSYC